MLKNEETLQKVKLKLLTLIHAYHKIECSLPSSRYRIPGLNCVHHKPKEAIIYVTVEPQIFWKAIGYGFLCPFHVGWTFRSVVEHFDLLIRLLLSVAVVPNPPCLFFLNYFTFASKSFHIALVFWRSFFPSRWWIFCHFQVLVGSLSLRGTGVYSFSLMWKRWG